MLTAKRNERPPFPTNISSKYQNKQERATFCGGEKTLRKLFHQRIGIQAQNHLSR